MEGVTVERIPMNVNYVEKPTNITIPYKHMKEVILERNHMNARNVGKLLDIPNLFDTRR